MRCPFCSNEDTQVKDSRPADDNSSIRRRRQCLVCGARFTTFERVQLRELTVIKRNGEKSIYDRNTHPDSQFQQFHHSWPNSRQILVHKLCLH